MNLYKIKLNTIEDVKNFSSKILCVESEALLRSEDRKYCINAKSIMGIFSLDLTKNLILEIDTQEEKFIKIIDDMGMLIEPISIEV